MRRMATGRRVVSDSEAALARLPRVTTTLCVMVVVVMALAMGSGVHGERTSVDALPGFDPARPIKKLALTQEVGGSLAFEESDDGLLGFELRDDGGGASTADAALVFDEASGGFVFSIQVRPETFEEAASAEYSTVDNTVVVPPDGGQGDLLDDDGDGGLSGTWGWAGGGVRWHSQ